MKSKIIVLLAVLLVAVFAVGAVMVSANSEETSEPAESTQSVAAESLQDFSEESAGESAVELSEEPPVRDSLTDEEYALLDAFLTALEDADPGFVDGELCWRNTEPTFLGTIGNYTVCEWGYMGHNFDAMVGIYYGPFPFCPYFASQCGVYLLGNDEIIFLEDALGELVTIEEMKEMLTSAAKLHLDRIYGSITELPQSCCWLEQLYGICGENCWRYDNTD